MRKRSLGWIVLFATLCGPTVASAALTASDDPLVVASSSVGQQTTRDVTLTAPGIAEIVDELLPIGAGCADVMLTPEVALPQLVTDLDPLVITVGVTPSVRGPVSCTIQLLDPADTVVGTFVVQGTGLAQDIAVPPTVDAGAVRVSNGAAQPTATRTISIDNVGDAGHPLVISNLAIIGGDSGDFTLLPTFSPTETVQPGGSLVLTVVFDPSASGSRTTSLAITSDDPSTPLLAVALTGTGSNAVIAVTDAAFGVVPVATTATRAVAVSRSGALPLGSLAVTSATITQSSTWFTFAGNGVGCLGATTCNLGLDITSIAGSVDVRCTPPALATGTQNATVTFASDSDLGGDASASLSCTAGAPQIEVPGVIALGNVEVGTTSASQTLIVRNIGTSPLTITDAAITVNAAELTAMGGPLGPQLTVIQPNGSASWTVACHPTTTGPRSGTFRVFSNSFTSGTATVPLTCTGQAGMLVVTPTTVPFGGVAQGTVVTQQVTLRNTGNVPVSGITAVIAPSTVGYSIAAATPVPTMLAAGASAMVTLQFAPLAGMDGGPATITFNGTWGTTPTATLAIGNLSGDGLTTGFDVTPPTLAFGDLRFDSLPTRTFCIVNTDQAPVTVMAPLSITPGTGTMSGEFVIGTVRRQAVCGTGGAVVGLPQTLLIGELLEVTVSADPANRTGAMNATLTVTSNLATNPTRTVTLTGNSTSAVVAVSPGATVDFGQVDLQGAPATRSITITNTGNAPLDLAAFQRSANAAFSFTLPPDTTLAPTQAVTIPVTYMPTVARAAGSDETVTITHAITGAIGSPGLGMIVLRGRGIDRDLELGDTPTFPATFRNPGTDGPVRAVTVRNPGEAPLVVSAVMVSNDPAVWKLLDADAVTIPGGGSFDFRVRFEPTAAGDAPDAKLQIVHDDDDDGPPITTRITEVVLDGVGLDRNVLFTPPQIDLGYTAIGVPVTLPEVMTVSSLDDQHTFRIRLIQIDGAAEGVFAVEGAPDDVPLDPAASRSFDVTFTPTVQGPFTATVRLFLDQDPLHQAEIEVRGTGVFVDARGGGGCATGHGLGCGAVILIAALALRRRRTAVAALVALALVPQPLDADDNVVLSVFDPTPSTTGTGFQLQSPEVGLPGEWVGTAVFSYATDPLLHFGSDGSQQGVISQSSMLELGGAIAFGHRFEAGARLPLYSQAGDPLGDPFMGYTTDPASGSARGDLSLHGKVQLLRRALAGDGVVAVGSSLQLTLPTATDGTLTGLDKPSARVLVLASLVPGAFSNRLTMSANLGAILRATATHRNLEQKSGIAWGLGASVRALDRLWLAGELFGDLVPAGRETVAGGSVALSPIEWLAGVQWRPDRRFTVGLAAGRGLTSAAGAPAFRGVLALTVAAGAPELRPLRGSTSPAPDLDSDVDGVRDRVDRCPHEPEDTDLFDDTDGCPDLDNDADGVVDAQDACAIDPEDKDGFEDADGCPDKDNDADGLADAHDRCPGGAEDKDGYEDLDGCPDLDNDRDGIADTTDRCPAEAETINGSLDDDGCPDRGASMVVLSPDRLETLDPLGFSSGTKIAKSSFNVLGQIGATLRAHPEIIRVRVTCHVNATKSPDKDQELSEKRAQAVRDWLVEWGVAATRLELRGFGSTKPLAAPEARNAALLNDRIELIILERK